MDDERRLLRKMARRDRSAWAIMYDRHVGDVFGVVYHLLGGDRHTAEDICQEVWLLAIERFEVFDVRRGVFRTWLLGVARHRVLHHHRRTANQAAVPILDGPTQPSPPLEVLVEGERASVVRAALLCLDGEHRRVLEDKYAEGLSVAEIAAPHWPVGQSDRISALASPRPLRELCNPAYQIRREPKKMNPSTCRYPDPDDESSIKRLIALAGDPAVAPRPEFVAELRSLLLDRLGPPRRARSWRPKYMIGSAVAAGFTVAAVVVVTCSYDPQTPGPRSLRPLSVSPWFTPELWAPMAWSTSRRGQRRKTACPLFVAGRMRSITTPRFGSSPSTSPPKESSIASRRTQKRNPSIPTFSRQLLDSKGPAKSPALGMDVVGQSRRDVLDDGRAWVDIELTLKVIGGDRQQTIRFRVDPKTKLPHSCVFQSIEGPTGTTLFDYPEHGPADIYDLGVPRAARLVDRMPDDDLDRVLTGLKAGRVRFDDYRGIVDWMDGFNINRVWRKGRKWRVEVLLPGPKQGERFPRSADAAWWKAHQNDFTFFVQAICDGERVYYYQTEGNSFMPGAKGPPRPKLSMEQAINPSDDPFMPWPHLFAEHVGHPAVWQPTDDREFVLESKPTDGPPGTIRLRVCETRPSDPRLPDPYKLWIDPRQNYLALRAESGVFESSQTAETRLCRGQGHRIAGPVARRPLVSHADIAEVFEHEERAGVALSSRLPGTAPRRNVPAPQSLKR